LQIGLHYRLVLTRQLQCLALIIRLIELYIKWLSVIIGFVD